MICKTRNERSHAWPGTWILRLDLWCGEGVWRTVMQNLFLFPNLRRLNLDSLHSADDLSVLFDQDLPALQELAIKPRKKPSARPSFGTWDYSYSPSIDRERSRAFFSRLSEVNFLSSLITKGTVPSLILDAAHDKLRQITFPPATPEEITTQFVSNCSDALSVLRIDMPAFSNSLSECLGTRCTGLRALDITCVEMIEPHGFECLMRVCGPHLIALRLGRAEDEGEIMDARIIRSVTSHCRSLESLGVAVHDFICDTEASFKDDLLDLVRQCGRALQYLSLSVVGWEGPLLGRAVLETIANSCPNLRYLQTDIWDVTPWDYDEQEAYNEEEAESSLLHGEGGAAAERAIFNRQVEALSKIVENCEFLKMIYLLENLENLDPPRPFLAAKLGDFVHYSCEPYFNWKRYM
ncbi:hypothetical protein HK102_001257 [Quaeritorhiza haematococci]|nr:hypothetical protein HK102_001257 [Quaeritorhiza haematococci]